MSTPNTVLMSQARGALKGKWGLALKITFLYWLMNIAISFVPVIGSIASFVITAPLILGLAGFWLAFANKEYLSFNKVLEGFHDFWRAFKAYILMVVYIILWSVLLIIPGIIAAISYSMTFFIMAEDKTIGANTALKKSKEMMYGYRAKFFFLSLQFIVRWLLIVVTPFVILSLSGYPFLELATESFFIIPIVIFMFFSAIASFWLTPYMYVTFARFYEDIKGKKENEVIPEVIPVPQA